MAFATLLLAVSAPVASAQSYSYSYFYETVALAPTAAPVVLAVTLTVVMDCADYGADEAAVFALAMEATISGATVAASENDCTDLSRRRNLLQAGSAALDFTVTVKGADAATATADSITTVVNDAVTSGDFATALTTAAANYAVSSGVTVTPPTVTGAVAVFAVAPTALPVPSPTASPVAAPAAPAPTASPVASVVLDSGSWRVAPGVGLLGTCIAALATAWV